MSQIVDAYNNILPCVQQHYPQVVAVAAQIIGYASVAAAALRKAGVSTEAGIMGLIHNAMNKVAVNPPAAPKA
jgi:ribose/xylose/arabinose/galactoside ABC-type transport system permease subunit